MIPLKPIYLLFSFTFLIVGCKAIVPANDSTNPTLLVSVVEPSGGNIIASTDSGIVTTNFVCPAGTDNAGQSKVHYVTTINNSSVDLRITSSDQGGVKYMFVNILNTPISNVNNVRVLNSSNITPTVTSFQGQARISVTFTEPKTAQILAFDITGATSAIVLETSTNDFSNNTTSIPTINTNEPRIQIDDISICNN